MSTDTYGVRVLARSGARVVYRVYSVYGDWTGLPSPASWDFFVRVASDGRWRLSDGDVMAQELGDNRWDESWNARNAPRFVRGARVLETANYPGKAQYTFYYERNGHWVDEDRLPQVVYEVEYAAERLVAHMTPGEAWGTTSYATDGPPRENADPALIAWAAQQLGDGAERDPAIVERCGREGIESTDTGTVVACLGVLARAGALARPFALRVAQLVSDREQQVMLAAVPTAGALAGEGCALCLSTLVVTLGWPYFRREGAIVRALGALGPRAALAADALARRARRGAPGRRRRAATALYAVTGDARVLARVVRDLANGGSRAARWAALDALAGVAPVELARHAPSFLPALDDAARLDEWPAVLDLLARGGPSLIATAAEPLARFAKAQRDDRPAFAREASELLARAGVAV